MDWNNDGKHDWKDDSIFHNVIDSDEKNTNYSRGSGCYIATCVYGSYDCPEVWTLRRFRDKKLGATVLGRAFIKVYYMVSPSIVKLFGGNCIFKAICQSILDALISKLQNKGIENTPYQDIDWRK